MLTEILKQYEKQGQESSQPRTDKVRFDVVLYYFIELHLPSTPNTSHSLDLSKDTRGGVLSKTLRTNRPGRQLVVAGKDGRALLSARTLLHHEKVRTQLWRPSTFHSTQKDVVVLLPMKRAAAVASEKITFPRINRYFDIRHTVDSAYRVTTLYFLHRTKPIFSTELG